MNQCPPTLRSAGVPPRPVSPPPGRKLAWATYDVVDDGHAVVEVTYLGAPALWTGARVEIRGKRFDVNEVDHLYEEAYRTASYAARSHGYELDRFSRLDPRGAGRSRGAR